MYGEGNAYSFEFRVHDPRIGRFWSIDPLYKKCPYWSPYQFAGNNVIQCVDIEGLETYSATVIRYDDCGYVVSIKVVDANRVKDSPTGMQINYTVYDLPRAAENEPQNLTDWSGNTDVPSRSPVLLTSSFYWEFNENIVIQGTPTNNGRFGPGWQVDNDTYRNNYVVFQQGANTQATTTPGNSNSTTVNLNFNPGTPVLPAGNQGPVVNIGRNSRTRVNTVTGPVNQVLSPSGLNLVPQLTQTTITTTQTTISIDFVTDRSNNPSTNKLISERFNVLSGILQGQGVPAGNISMGTTTYNGTSAGSGNSVTFNTNTTTTTITQITCP